jgi:hypothetical protein
MIPGQGQEVDRFVQNSWVGSMAIEFAQRRAQVAVDPGALGLIRGVHLRSTQQVDAAQDLLCVAGDVEQFALVQAVTGVSLCPFGLFRRRRPGRSGEWLDVVAQRLDRPGDLLDQPDRGGLVLAADSSDQILAEPRYRMIQPASFFDLRDDLLQVQRSQVVTDLLGHRTGSSQQGCWSVLGRLPARGERAGQQGGSGEQVERLRSYLGRGPHQVERAQHGEDLVVGAGQAEHGGHRLLEQAPLGPFGVPGQQRLDIALLGCRHGFPGRLQLLAHPQTWHPRPSPRRPGPLID